MRISFDQLRNLPVETTSGRPVGRVVDLELDVEQQAVQTYHVRSRTVIPGLFQQRLLIDRRQVVAITSEKMVVEETVLGAAEPVLGQPEPGAPSPA